MARAAISSAQPFSRSFAEGSSIADDFALHATSDFAIGRIRASKSLRRSMNNVFQITEFAGPLAVRALPGRMGPKPLAVHIEGDFFITRFMTGVVARGIAQLSKGAD